MKPVSKPLEQDLSNERAIVHNDLSNFRKSLSLPLPRDGNSRFLREEPKGQRVVVEGETSGPASVKSGVPQGSVHGHCSS